MARKCKTTLALLLCLLFCFQLLPVSAYAEDENVSVVAEAGDTVEKTIKDEDVASVYVQATGEGSKASAEVGTGSGTAVTGAVNVIAQDGGNASAKIDGDVGGERNQTVVPDDPIVTERGADNGANGSVQPSGVTVVVAAGPTPAPSQPPVVVKGPAPGGATRDAGGTTASDGGTAEVTVTGDVKGYLDVITETEGGTATGTVDGSVLMYDDNGTYHDHHVGPNVTNGAVLAAGEGSTATVGGDAYSVAAPYVIEYSDASGNSTWKNGYPAQPIGAAAFLGGEVTVDGNVAAVGIEAAPGTFPTTRAMTRDPAGEGSTGGDNGGSPFAIVDPNNSDNHTVAIGTAAVDGTVDVGESVTAISPNIAIGAMGFEGFEDYANIASSGNGQPGSSSETPALSPSGNEAAINIGGDLQVIGSAIGLGSAMIGGSTLDVAGDVYVGGKDSNDALSAIAAAYGETYGVDEQTAIQNLKDSLQEKGFLRAGIVTVDVIEPARTLLDSGVLEEILGEELYGMLESTGALDMAAQALQGFAEETVPSVTVGGDVTVEDARLAVGLVGNGDFDIAGTVTVSGDIAGGAILIGSNFPAEGAAESDSDIAAFQTAEPTMATAKLHDVTVEGKDVGVGVAAIYGAAQIDGNIEVSGENAVGVLQTASDVRVNGDVTVESDGSEKELGATGAALVNVGDLGDAVYNMAFQVLSDMLTSEDPAVQGLFAQGNPDQLAAFQYLAENDPEYFKTFVLAQLFQGYGLKMDVDPDTNLPTGDPYIPVYDDNGNATGEKISVDPANIIETVIGLAKEQENVLVVDGTISADYGLMVVDKAAAVGLAVSGAQSVFENFMDLAFAMAEAEGVQTTSDLATLMADLETAEGDWAALAASYQAELAKLEAMDPIPEDQQARYHYLSQAIQSVNMIGTIESALGVAADSVETYSQQEDLENTLPDVTVWKIQTTDEHSNIVRSGAVSVSLEDLVGSVVTEDDIDTISAAISSGGAPEEDYPSLIRDLIMGITLSTSLDEDYANEVENNIHYMVRVNSIKDTDGNELDLSALSFVREDGEEALVDNQGFLTAKMGTYTIKAANAEYEIESLWNGEGSEDDGYGFQAMRAESSYNLARGGGILINAVLKLITPEPEPEPEPEPQPEPQPEPEPEPKPEEAEEAATPVKGLTWAAQIRASAKNARLTFDATYMEYTLFNICADYAQALKERPDVTVTIVFMDNGERVSITIEPNTDVVGALAKEDLTDHDEIAFPKLAELLELTPEAFQG